MQHRADGAKSAASLLCSCVYTALRHTLAHDAFTEVSSMYTIQAASGDAAAADDDDGNDGASSSSTETVFDDSQVRHSISAFFPSH